MAAHIPTALSLLHSVATAAYPAFQRATNPAPSVAPSSQNNTSSAPYPPPMNIPGSLPQTTPPIGALGVSPPNNTISNMCESCHQRPKHNDGSKTHAYCSKTCANKAKNVSPNPTSTSANCEHCKTRAKYFDGAKTHPYCSKACAQSAASVTNSSNNASNAGTTNGTSTKTTPQRKGTIAGSAGSTKGLCQISGCQKTCFTNPNGSLADFCGQAHKTLGETICLMCRQAAKQPGSHFCGQACADDCEKAGPLLLEVPRNHITFKSVADQFKASWRHTGTTCPPVRRVYKIQARQASLASYNAYRASVEARGQFVAAGRSIGNENRRWHGTRRECTLGDKGNTKTCSSQTCSLCCIVRTSFDLSLWGKKTGWGRFGKGIYTSSTSSKSNDYSQNDCNSPFKTVLLNKVVVGKGCKMLQDSTSLTAPPAGFDSVLAEKGGSLNYDELVVYRNDAIRPSFLVVYEP
ncbi:hypothetical protein BDZ94DRAFT_1217414 [Collybia nuda]|uniref:PARP catalytic domain-containing protein n=1 Tax=Collybia nuda TaxID=64659 RepID=A0A9P5Y7X8_9AGAR|nr:hypothetical protein BDZ94DRAFT_1217414 [Collybia nuda]